MHAHTDYINSNLVIIYQQGVRVNMEKNPKNLPAPIYIRNSMNIKCLPAPSVP